MVMFTTVYQRVNAWLYIPISGEILMAGVRRLIQKRHAATQKTQEELDAEERRWQSLFKEDISLDIDIQWDPYVYIYIYIHIKY